MLTFSAPTRLIVVASVLLLMLALAAQTTPKSVVAEGAITTQADNTTFIPAIRIGTDGAPPQEPPFSDDPLSPEARAQSVESMRNTLDDLLPPPDVSVQERDLQGELELMSDALLELPDVIATVIHTETLAVHAILSDGLPITVINNRPPGIDELQPENESTAAWTPDSASNPTPVLPVEKANTASVPGSARAVVTYFDGGASVRNQVASMLSEAGYDVLGLGADIEAMRNYSDLGALYLDTHGASFLQVEGIRETEDGSNAPVFGDSVFALQSSTSVTAATLADQYLDDLENGRIVVSFVETDQGWEAKLAITEKFIQHYWSFDDAIVMIHACFGGAGPFSADNSCNGACVPGQAGVFDPTPLRQAMINKGAKAVVSFDNYTNTGYARPSILYFFDRLLGADEYRPLSPPSRPFPWEQVRSAMGEAGLLRFNKPSFILGPFDFGGNDVNVTFMVTGDGAGLAPSIEKVDIVDDAAQEEGELTLFGNFGDSQGTVQLGGSTLSVRSWSDTRIVADAPFDLTGDLIVKSPGDVESNPVPITKWSGRVTYSILSQGSLRADSEFDIRFRADAHDFRTSLADSPSGRTVEAYLSGESTGVTRGSGTYVQEGGEIRWSGNTSMDVYGKTVIDTFGDGVLPNAFDNTAQNNDNFGGVVTLDTQANHARLCMASFGTFLQQGQGQSTIMLHVLLGNEVPGLTDGARGFMPCVDLAMQSDFTLAGGSRSAAVEEITFRLEWTSITPENPPNPETPG